MVNYYRRVVLDGVEIFFLESVAGFCRNKHFPGKGNCPAGVFRSDGFLGGQSFINADNEFGNVVQPGELRVVDNQAEELAGVDVTVLALVFTAFHIEKRLVEAEKSEAEREKLFAGRGIVVRGVQI